MQNGFSTDPQCWKRKQSSKSALWKMYSVSPMFSGEADKKDFGAISRAVSNCIKILEEILTNKNTDLLKSFNPSCFDIVRKIDDYQMQLTVSGSTRKKHAEDRFSNGKDQFYETVIKPFVSALIVEKKGAFDMFDIPIYSLGSD